RVRAKGAVRSAASVSAPMGMLRTLAKSAFHASTEVELILKAPSTRRFWAAMRLLDAVAAFPSPRKWAVTFQGTSDVLRHGLWRALGNGSVLKSKEPSWG